MKTPDHQPDVRSRPEHLDHAEEGRSWSVVSNLGGFTMGLVGVGAALVTLSSGVQKFAGVLLCSAFTVVVWRGTHAWDRNPLDRWFAALLVVFLGLSGWFVSLLLTERAANEHTLRVTNAELRSRVVQLEQNIQSQHEVDRGTGKSATASTTSSTQAPAPTTKFLDSMAPVEGDESVTAGSWALDGTVYDHSLGIDTFCYSSILGYNIERKYQTFQATVGMTNDVPTGTKLRFTILSEDGKEVARRDTELGKPMDIDANVSGILRLILRIEMVLNFHDCFPPGLGAKGVAVWGQARVY